MNKQDWDVLIILDACRYDYFEKHYKKFMSGKLKSMESVATDTVEWLVKTFNETYHDIIYVSASAFINSEIESKSEKYTFFANEKFFKIIDVWDSGLDEELGVVRAEVVNSEYKKYKLKYPHKKFILHYMQPHYPFVPLSIVNPDSRVGKRFASKSSWIKRSISKLFRFFHLNLLEIRNKFGSPTNQVFYLRRKYGDKRLREEYEKNLLYVLEKVGKILPEIDGKVVIIGDHGTLLGEHGKYGHFGHKRYKEILEVPYFEVEKSPIIKRTKRKIQKI